MGGTIAIDLGSTSTVVAYQAPGEPPRLLCLTPYSLDDPCVVPSLLWLASADVSKALLGRQVLDADLAHGDGPQLQRDFKRRIGLGLETPSGLPLSAEAAGARLLRQLWQALPAQISPERLVLTAPVDLSLVQLQGGEGRAAPIAQLLRLRGQSLGASRQQLRCAQVLGKAGLAIGGRDIDRWIAAHLWRDANPNGTLLGQAERLKCQLSDQPLARAIWAPSSGPSQELQLSRDDLAELLRQQGFIAQLDGLLESVLAQGRRAGVELEQISAVLPVGGSSRLAAVQAWLQERLGSLPIHHQRPIEAVALGALALTPGVRVRDVLSRGVSLRCWDRRSRSHRWHPLYVPGQHWPTDHPLEVVLACSHDGQGAIEMVLGEPLDQQRAEVVFENGLPRLRQRPGPKWCLRTGCRGCVSGPAAARR